MHLRPRRLPSLRRPASSFARPAPPALPPRQQREFEDLQRAAVHAAPEVHPDARKPLGPDFDGDTNPLTGEQGGPKQEPVRRWVDEDSGDWSFKGRVSDF